MIHVTSNAPSFLTGSPAWLGLDTTAWWAIAGILVTAVIGAIGIVVAIRYGNRRGKVALLTEVTPLIPSNLAKKAELEVTYRNIAVANPHLVRITLVNVGPRDIGTSHFDGGRPLQITLSSPIFGLVSSNMPGRTLGSAVGGREIALTPGMLPRQRQWDVELIVDGNPEFDLDMPLLDTDVEWITQEREALLREAVLGSFARGLNGGIVGIFAQAFTEVARGVADVLIGKPRPRTRR